MDETLKWFMTADLSEYEDKSVCFMGKEVPEDLMNLS